MKHACTKALLAAALAASAFSFTPAASAQSLQLDLSGKNGPKVRVLPDCNPDREDCGPPRRRDDYVERRRPMRFCTEERAMDKAERMGLRRVQVEDANRRSIEVSGYRGRGRLVTIEFGRAPNCPILG